MENGSDCLVAIHAFNCRTVDELTLRKGDRIEILETDDGFNDGWYTGRNINTNQTGLFPYVYTAPLSSHSASLSQDSTNQVSEDDSQKHASIYDAFNDVEHALSEIGPQSNNVTAWSPRDVSQYLAQQGFEPDVCGKFVEHKITGEILLELELSHLKELDITSFGTRFALNKAIEKEEPKQQPTTPNLSAYNRTTSQYKHKSVQPLETDNRSRYSSRPNSHARQRSRSLDALPENQHRSAMPSFDKNWQLPQSPRSPQSPQMPDVHPLVQAQIDSAEPHSSQFGSTDFPMIEERSTENLSSRVNLNANPESPHIESGSRQDMEQPEETDSTSRSSMSASLVAESMTSPVASTVATPDMRNVDSSATLTIGSPYPAGYEFDDQLDSAALKNRSAEHRSQGLVSPKRAHTEPFNAHNPPYFNRAESVPLRAASSALNTKSPKKFVKQNTSAFLEGRQNITPNQSAASGTYSGWMSKRGGSGVGTWKNRFFVLHGTRLSYFGSNDDRKEKGLIDITAHRVVPIRANEDKLVALYAASTGSGRYCFKLIPPAPGSRKGVTFTAPKVHYFAVDTREELRNWMNALMKATIDRDDSVPVISSCTTPTVSLAKAREMNALAMEARAEELRMTLVRESSESVSSVSTPDLSASKDSDNSEQPLDAVLNLDLKDLSLRDGTKAA